MSGWFMTVGRKKKVSWIGTFGRSVGVTLTRRPLHGLIRQWPHPLRCPGYRYCRLEVTERCQRAVGQEVVYLLGQVLVFFLSTEHHST